MRFTGLIISMAVSILVLISAAGGAVASVPAALISAAPTVAPDQPPAASVMLAVVDLDGAPAASAVVRLSGDQTAEQDSGDDGVASFEGLSAGIYSIQATAGGLSHVRITFELAESESLELSATLRPVKEFAISGAIRDIGDLRFNDTIPGPTIAVDFGDLVRVAFSVPEDDIVHVLSIDEFGVTSPNVRKGESTVIEFIADERGQFSYYCPLPSHRAQGMEGAFEVN